MNTVYLEKAKSREPNVPRLINMVSRRVKQLIAGDRPLVKPDSVFMERLDLALKEIAEGKLTAEMIYVEKPDATPETNFLAM
ncbi:MAG: DNA-directed RNA polymerase subunit omega [Kiritimatiellia bacterium]|nr:DNA-directed RNA polymerase subunit omega [Kiritimatiellia bacterium]